MRGIMRMWRHLLARIVPHQPTSEDPVQKWRRLLAEVEAEQAICEDVERAGELDGAAMLLRSVLFQEDFTLSPDDEVFFRQARGYQQMCALMDA